MQEIGGKPWFRERWRWPGLALAVWFGFHLTVCAALACVGRVTTGYPATLRDRDPRADEGPVLYVYHVGGGSWTGWRRGIVWGGEPFSVVYLPFLPRYHFTSLQADVPGPAQFLAQPDYWIRVVFNAGGMMAGILLSLYLKRIPRLLPKNCSLLPGLEDQREGRPRGPGSVEK